MDIRKGTKLIETDDNEDKDAIRMIMIEDLRNDKNIKYTIQNKKNVIVDIEDIIIAWDGANAGLIGFDLEGALGSTLARLSLKNKKIYPIYLGLYLLSKFEEIRFNCTGATIPHVNRNHLIKMKIPVPPINIQKQIVEILDEAQALIDNRKEQIKLLDDLIESVFYDMFGDPVRNDKGWEVKELGNYINVMGGYAFKSKKYVDEGIPIIKIGNINRGYFEDKNLSFYEETESLKRFIVKEGDLVMSLTGTVGKDDYGNVCILDNSYEVYYLNQRNAKIEILNDLNKLYLTYLLRNKGIKQHLVQVDRGVRQANISNSDILKLEVPIPPIDIQNEFEEKTDQIESQKQLLERSLKLLEDNYNSLMQKAFKGELFN